MVPQSGLVPVGERKARPPLDTSFVWKREMAQKVSFLPWKSFDVPLWEMFLVFVTPGFSFIRLCFLPVQPTLMCRIVFCSKYFLLSLLHRSTVVRVILLWMRCTRHCWRGQREVTGLERPPAWILPGVLGYPGSRSCWGFDCSVWLRSPSLFPACRCRPPRF